MKYGKSKGGKSNAPSSRTTKKYSGSMNEHRPPASKPSNLARGTKK